MGRKCISVREPCAAGIDAPRPSLGPGSTMHRPCTGVFRMPSSCLESPADFVTRGVKNVVESDSQLNNSQASASKGFRTKLHIFSTQISQICSDGSGTSLTRNLQTRGELPRCPPVTDTASRTCVYTAPRRLKAQKHAPGLPPNFVGELLELRHTHAADPAAEQLARFAAERYWGKLSVECPHLPASPTSCENSRLRQTYDSRTDMYGTLLGMMQGTTPSKKQKPAR